MIGRVAKAFAHLLYPPLCLHCRGVLGGGSSIFCQSCLDLMQLIDPAERCPLCFSAAFDSLTHFCAECSKKTPIFDRTGAVFDYVGPASTLVRRMKYSDQPYLAKGAGAYMTAQLLRLEWPMPDFLIPVPLSFMHWLERGYNQSLLLCESMAEILQLPVADILVRSSGDFSQAALSRKQRMELEGKTFKLKPKVSLSDKTILLVDDVMTTGSTLRKCGEILLEQGPAKIYCLVLCKTLK